MAIGTGSDPLSGAPDAGVRGRAAFGAPTPSFSPSAPAIFHTPDPFADYGQDFMANAPGAGPSAVSFPLQDPMGGGVSFGPWTVRWHEDEGGRNGQYEVLSPTGNFGGIGVCEVMNKKATDTSGHGYSTDTGWYKIGVGDLNDGDYQVVAHFKAAAKFGDRSYRRPAVFVGIMEASAEPTDYADTYAGDYASFVVATIHVETDDETGEKMREISQIVSTPYTVDMAVIGMPCILGVDCTVSGSTLTVSRFGFDTEHVTAAGVSGDVSLDLGVGDACTVWLHAKAEGGQTSLELKKFGATSSPTTQYSDTEMYICLYRISDYGTVVGDYRANLQAVPYYR